MNPLFILPFLAFLLSSCSTALDKTYQEITVETPGAMEALCTLENRDFKYVVRAPKTLTITKSVKPLNVSCIAPGNREKTIIVTPKVSDAAFLNVGNGIVPGTFIDYKTAALYSFPDVISVDFTDVPAKRMPLPAYQQLLNDNPMLVELEEFRPGRSALQRDRYDRIPTLQKITSDEMGEVYGEEGVATESVSEGPTYSVHDKAPAYEPSALPSTLDPVSSGTPTSLLPSPQE